MSDYHAPSIPISLFLRVLEESKYPIGNAVQCGEHMAGELPLCEEIPVSLPEIEDPCWLRASVQPFLEFLVLQSGADVHHDTVDGLELLRKTFRL